MNEFLFVAYDAVELLLEARKLPWIQKTNNNGNNTVCIIKCRLHLSLSLFASVSVFLFHAHAPRTPSTNIYFV